MNDIQCIAPVGDICGEAATWSAEENAIYWVDINRFLIHRFSLENQSTKSFQFDEPVVALSLTDITGKMLVALSSQLIFFFPESNDRKVLDVTLPDFPEARFNDGRSDPNGVFWIGSMGNNVGKNGENLDVQNGLGKLYRYEYGHKLEEVETGIGISNTLCWSPDQSQFYFGDTLKNEIRKYPFNKQNSTLGKGKSFFKNFDRGLPDGSTMDSEGYLWNCRFSGKGIVRVSPKGDVDKIIEMPVENITTCTFGGENLSTLFITTASVEKVLTDRLAGSLFAIETGTQGMSENKFKTLS